MKKILKIIVILLAAIVLVGIFAGDDSDSEGKHEDLQVEGNETNENDDIAIEEQVLVDQDGIVITAKEYVEDSIWGEGISVSIENNTDKNLSVSTEALIVNNYMVSDLFVSSIAAGKKSNETIYFSSSELEAAGIENVGQVEFYFYAFDDETFETCFEWEPVTLKTTAYENMDITPNDSGTELYNKDGVRIVGKMVDENSFWGTAVLLYMENKTGKAVTISCDDMSVNGLMVSPLFSSTIYDEKMAVSEMTIFESDLEENAIEKVEEIEFAFEIYDSNTFDTIDKTEPLKITVE